MRILRQTISFRQLLLPALVFALSFSIASVHVAHAQGPDKEAAEKYNDGLAKLKAKDYEGALTSFLAAKETAEGAGDESTASKAQKYAYRLCYNVGVGYLKKGDMDRAMSFFDRGIAMEPTYYKNYKGKATIYNRQGNVEAAIEAWVKTSEVASQAGELEERRKARKQAEGFVAKAMQDRDFERVVEIGQLHSQFAETSDVYYYMAHAQNQLGNYESAVEHADKALGLETGSRAARAKIYFEKAEAHKALSQYEDALDAYTQAAVGEFAQRARHEIEVLSGSY
jgi:tetratricopeptide (TPR) repeat protein